MLVIYSGYTDIYIVYLLEITYVNACVYIDEIGVFFSIHVEPINLVVVLH